MQSLLPLKNLRVLLADSHTLIADDGSFLSEADQTFCALPRSEKVSVNGLSAAQAHKLQSKVKFTLENLAF